MTVKISLLSLFLTLASFSTLQAKAEVLQEAEIMKNRSLLRHVVLFQFKEGTSSEKIKEIEAAFHDLPSKISEIYSYEWGLNNSPENLNKNFTFLEDVLVVDYWAE